MIPLNHTGTAAQTSLSASASEAATVVMIVPPSAGSWPQADFVITVDRGSPSEEKMLVTAVSTDRAALTVVRGFDGTAPSPHNPDAVVEHTISAAEMQWLSDHINSASGHLLTSPIVGVDDSQTLTNKIIDDSNNDISITVNSILNYQQLMTIRDGNFVQRNQPLFGDTRTPNEAGVPTGTMILWTGATQSKPVGWLLCDGASLSQADYRELYSVVGNAFTPSPSAETFAIPDMRSMEPPNMHYYIFDGLGGP